MPSSADIPTGALVIRPSRSGEPYWHVKFRMGGAQKLPKLAPARVERRAGEWVERKRRGPDDPALTRKQARARVPGFMAEFFAEVAAREERARLDEERARLLTVRDAAGDWLAHLRDVDGARPSTLRDYASVLAEPGTPHKRGKGHCEGRIMAEFGDRVLAPTDGSSPITKPEVEAFLRRLTKDGMTARSVNKQRQVLSAVFNHVLAEMEHVGLRENPVARVKKRREAPVADLDFYEPAEVELIAATLASGQHREEPKIQFGDDEIVARAVEDAQLAELVRVLAYTGMRLGEARALRWRDVALEQRMMHVRRAFSGGVEGPTKGRRARAVPLADPARDALERLRARHDFTSRDDYVFASRVGDRLDDSAIRRRFGSACDAAGVRRLRLHDLRHTAGSLAARELDATTVQRFLGHAKLSTTERYLHAKSRPEDVERLNRAFGGSGVLAED